jgi:hypothetical protein
LALERVSVVAFGFNPFLAFVTTVLLAISGLYKIAIKKPLKKYRMYLLFETGSFDFEYVICHFQLLFFKKIHVAVFN